MQTLDSSATLTLAPSLTGAPLQKPPVIAAEAWMSDWLAPEWLELPESKALYAQDLRGAERLRAALCGVPFHAKKALAAKEAGDEMAYWLGLHYSAPNRFPA